MYNPYISGKNVYLRHPTRDDVDGRWHEWFSDEETTRSLVDRFWPNSREAQAVFYETILTDRCSLVLSIIDQATDSHIGVCSLGRINWVHRYSDIAIVLGEKEYRKGAYAFESLSLLLSVAFGRLNLGTVKSSHLGSNVITEHLLKALGFKQVGIYTDLCFVGGQKEDLVVSMLDRDSWAKRQGPAC